MPDVFFLFYFITLSGIEITYVLANQNSAISSEYLFVIEKPALIACWSFALRTAVGWND